MLINGVETSAFVINKVSSEVDSLDGLDGVIIQTVANKISVMQEVKIAIYESLKDPDLMSDPGMIARVQAVLADYTLQISMMEKMASGALKTIDTLVKS